VPPPQKGQVILVFTPHPDDETIAAGGYIYSAEQAGAEVWIALVTNGNYRGLEEQRYEEFKKAAGILGVPEDHLFFLGYPDHELKSQDQNQVRSRFAEIISTTHPQIIISPTPLDHHPDHRATGILVVQAMAGTDAVLYQYLVHHNLFPHPKGMNPELYVLPPARMINLNWEKYLLSEQLQTQKHKAVLQYKTQISNSPDPLLPGLLLGMVRKNELFIVPGR
jgi:LmbE family N-acetylglucosaminyl deacetylase